MMGSYVLGVDTSTTATKAVLVDAGGSIVGVGSCEYGYDTPHPLWSEQDPELWWNGTVDAIRRVLAKTGVPTEAIAGVGLTGQMHGLVLLDTTDRVIRPAILWNDQRTAAECDQIRELIGKDRLVAITGNDALPGFTSPKLLWVLNNEPAYAAAISHVLLPKDFVRLRLTGEHAVDRAGGSGTQLFDLVARDWSGEIIGDLSYDPGWFPDSFEGTDVTGEVTAAAAEATGLREGIPVVAGGGDQAANAVGTGAVVEGIVTASLGTSGVVFVTSNGPRIEPEGRVHAFCHAVPGAWHMMGVMLSAAGSLRWFRDNLAPGAGFAELAASASASAPGADGLVFLPYLTGERTPHPDPEARGAFIGLTVRHERHHLVRAIMEGVAFGLKDILDLMYASGIEPVEQIRLSGGGAQSAEWRQIIADVLDVAVIELGTAEGAALGAAKLAAVGLGWFPDPQAGLSDWVSMGQVTEPSSDADTYVERHAVYKGLYPMLRDTFPKLR